MFAIIPFDWMFADRVAGRSRKYLAGLYGQLSFHDDETAAVFHSPLKSRLWLQIHRDLLVLNSLLPTVRRCRDRNEG